MTKRERNRLEAQAQTMGPTLFRPMLNTRANAKRKRLRAKRVAEIFRERDLRKLDTFRYSPRFASEPDERMGAKESRAKVFERFEAAMAGKPIAVPYKGSVRQRLNAGRRR